MHKDPQKKRVIALASNDSTEKQPCRSFSAKSNEIITYNDNKSPQFLFNTYKKKFKGYNSFNILKWCDEKISFLKKNKIKFKNGYPVLKYWMLYKDIPQNIIPLKYFWEISKEEYSKTLIANFVADKDLFTRLRFIDKDVKRMCKYGGITGFDFSASILMLPIRQKFSLLVNCIYDCYVGLHGIKVLPNARIGELCTMSVLKHFPHNCNFIVGELGCRNNGYKAIGNYLLLQILKIKKPKVLFIYGGFLIKEAKSVLENRNCKIVVFPGRNSTNRHKDAKITFKFSNGKLIKVPYIFIKERGEKYGS